MMMTRFWSRILPLLLPVLAIVSASGIPIVDTHVHLTNVSLFNYTWQPAYGQQLGFDWTLDNYSQAIANASFQPSKVVFIEVHVDPPNWILEAEYIQRLADNAQPGSTPEIGAIVAWAPVEQGANVSIWLDRLRDKVPLLRGIRRPIPGAASNPPASDPCGYTHGEFVSGVSMLADYNLHFEFLIEEDVAGFDCSVQFIKQLPHVTFVVEHLGTPDIAGNKTFDSWAETMTQLAELPNVHIKLSGAPREDLHNNQYGDWSVDDIRHYVAHLVKVFGYERLMFGGNWFFVNLSTSLSKWTDAVSELLSDASPEQRAAVLGGNAVKVYRIQN